MPRGSALGMVTQLPSSDETSVSKKQLLARLDVCMGGRVAEELIFGQDHVTTGASSDLHTATELAHYMVYNFYLNALNNLYLPGTGDHFQYFMEPIKVFIKKIIINVVKVG
jgi:ATP-dependent Zn protease